MKPYRGRKRRLIVIQSRIEVTNVSKGIDGCGKNWSRLVVLQVKVQVVCQQQSRTGAKWQSRMLTETISQPKSEVSSRQWEPNGSRGVPVVVGKNRIHCQSRRITETERYCIMEHLAHRGLQQKLIINYRLKKIPDQQTHNGI